METHGIFLWNTVELANNISPSSCLAFSREICVKTSTHDEAKEAEEEEEEEVDKDDDDEEERESLQQTMPGAG